MEIATAVRVMMLANGETQQNLADLLGLSKQAVTLKLNGRRRFNLQEVRTILKHYNVSPDELYKIFFEE